MWKIGKPGLSQGFDRQQGFPHSFRSIRRKNREKNSFRTLPHRHPQKCGKVFRLIMKQPFCASVGEAPCGLLKTFPLGERC